MPVRKKICSRCSSRFLLNKVTENRLVSPGEQKTLCVRVCVFMAFYLLQIALVFSMLTSALVIQMMRLSHTVSDWKGQCVIVDRTELYTHVFMSSAVVLLLKNKNEITKPTES